MNSVYISGRLQKPPEVRYTQTGKKVVSGSIEWSKKTKDREKKGWFKFQAWGQAADTLSEMRQDDRILVTGELETNSWEGKDGKKNYETRINVFEAFTSPTLTQQIEMPDSIDSELPF